MKKVIALLSFSWRPVGCHLLAAALGFTLATSARGQATPPASQADAAIELSPFRVDAAADRGYSSANALGATRVKIPIVNVPTTIVVLNEEFLKDMGATDNLDAFRYVSGMAENSLIYNGQVTIRGYQQGDGISFRDGLPDNISVGGGPMNDFANIQRVEVIKGPNGVLYGSHAPGGVVNSITKKPLFQTQTEVEFVTGSWNLARGEVDTTGPVGQSKNLAYRLVLMYQDGETYNYGPMDKTMIAPSLTWLVGKKSQLTFQYMYFKPNIATSRTQWFSDFAGQISTFLPIRSYFDEDDEYRMHWIQSYDLSFEHTFNEAWTFRAVGRFTSADENKFNYNKTNYRFLNKDGTPMKNAAGVNATYRNFTFAEAFANPNFGDIIVDRVRRRDLLKNERAGAYVDVVGDLKLGPTSHKLITSLQATVAEGTTQQWLWNYPSTSVITPTYVDDPLSVATNFRLNTDTTADSDGYSAGVQDNISLLNDRLFIVGGARFDHYENSGSDLRTGISSSTEGDDWSYRLGGLYKVHGGLSVYANWSQTFIPISGTNSAGVPFKNQIGETKEGGFKLDAFNGRLAGTFSVFELTLDNFIRQVLVDVSNGLVERVQSGVNTAKGFEADLTWQPVDEVTLLLAYGDLTSQDENGIAARGIGQGVNWKLFGKYAFLKGPLKGLAVGAGYVHNARASGDANATFFHPAYGVADAFVAYSRQRWSAQVNFTNLTSEIYSSSVSDQFVAAGRPFEFRVTLRTRF